LIRPLRIAHRRIWAVLALGLPALVLAALAARRPVPVVADAIPFHAPAGRLLYQVEGRRADDALVRASLYRATDGAFSVPFPRQALEGLPEVLAYWIPTDGVDPIEDGTPLGQVRGDEPLGLPDRVGTTPGVIALYDLAHGDVVATLRLPGRGAS
jgi:hypothetical protein